MKGSGWVVQKSCRSEGTTKPVQVTARRPISTLPKDCRDGRVYDEFMICCFKEHSTASVFFSYHGRSSGKIPLFYLVIVAPPNTFRFYQWGIPPNFFWDIFSLCLGWISSWGGIFLVIVAWDGEKGRRHYRSSLLRETTEGDES